jgi:hypothetical protein
MATAAPNPNYVTPTDGLQVGSGIDRHGFYVLRYRSKDRSLVRHYDNGLIVVEVPPSSTDNVPVSMNWNDYRPDNTPRRFRLIDGELREY